ncbi:MAG: gluconate 2-dehydrogenase subunit 3 family protein [Nitrososphaerales archaeon]|jgi:gluconate 2-dehydrogenase gamma chain
MADTRSENKRAGSSDRRTFLKIGAGVVVGAAVAGVATDAYLSSVIGSNNSSSSSTVSSLSDQLSTTAAQLSTAQAQAASLSQQLSSTQAQATSLSNQLSSTQSQLASANSALTSANSQLSTTQSQLSTTQAQLSTAQSQLTSAQGQVSTLSSQVSANASTISAYSGNADAVVTLGLQEATVVAALANTIIPADSNGPGALEAGVLIFIDRQLNGDYGNNGRMYNAGPFIMPQTAGPITVDSASGPITYSAGTVNPNITWSAGQEYQYGMSLRNFWRYGILALETYANSAYGGNYETLSAANQLACLQDLFNNKPTTFNEIIPSDFANEVFFMTWAGYTSDPIYGGNRGMAGWTYTASPGLNNGNFYGEGMTTKQLMVATTPTILKPVSLSQFQQAQGVPGVPGGSS